MSARAELCGLFLAADGRKRVVVPADLGSRGPIVVWRPNVRTRSDAERLPMLTGRAQAPIDACWSTCWVMLKPQHN